MIVSRDLEKPQPGQEVVLFCLAGGQITCCFARRHWFTEDDKTRREGWQSTWDGAEVPREWRPYAWGTFEAPDPAEDVV